MSDNQRTGSEIVADSLVGLMNQLAEVPTPPAVSMVPQTIGWQLLALVFAGLAAWTGLLWFRRHRANAYRRAALRELKAAGDDPVAISHILKRAALVVYGRKRVANLSGAQWLSFLDQTGADTRFAGDVGEGMANAAYRPVPTKGHPDLPKMAQQWIKQHDPVKAETQNG